MFGKCRSVSFKIRGNLEPKKREENEVNNVQWGIGVFVCLFQRFPHVNQYYLFDVCVP